MDKGVFRTGGVVERLPLKREPNPNPNPNPNKSFERDLKLLSRSCTEHYNGRLYFADRPREADLYKRIGTRVSLPPLAVAQRMEVTVGKRSGGVALTLTLKNATIEFYDASSGEKRSCPYKSVDPNKHLTQTLSCFYNGVWKRIGGLLRVIMLFNAVDRVDRALQTVWKL